MRQSFKSITMKLALFSLAGLLVGQGSGYLAQKLMVENNIRERVRDALSKIVDNNKYVINVDVDLEISDEVEEQITVLAERENQKVEIKPEEPTETEKSLSSIQQSIDIEENVEKSSYSVGLPIPGFEMDFSSTNKTSKKAEKPAPPVISVETKDPIEVTSPDVDSNEPRVDKILSRTRPSRAEIKKMYISLILQEGAAPELIENIRQLTMAASKFDRNRGDKLTIMTASFREKRDQRSAEQIMLKNIAEKIELLEQKKREIEENTQDRTWKDELTRYRDEESARREEDRKFFEGQISQLEQQAKDRAYAQEKKDMLLRDSLKLKKLNDEIVALKGMLKSSERRDSLKSISKQERLDSLRYANLSSELDELAKSLQVAVSKESKDEEVIAKRKIQEEMAEREAKRGP